jgi:UPF0755 protein
MRVLAVALVVLLLAAGGGYFYLNWATNTPMEPGSIELVRFEVPKGASFNQVGGLLVKGGFVRSELLFKLWLKLHPTAPAPKAGKHDIGKGMNLEQILNELGGKPISEDVPLTMVEGWRLRDADKILAEKGLIEPGEYMKAASDKSRFKLNFPIEGSDLAGYLYPETYMVPPGKLDVNLLIQRQLNRFEEVFLIPHDAEIKASGRPLHTIVIVASLLEREERKVENRAEVAGVIYKRLQLNTPLGIDATSHFTLENWNDGKGLRAQLKDPNDPWNTRLRPGLPPGPIGEPGLPSLQGALRGKPSKWLYYLHDKDGNLHLSRNGDEHEAKRKKYNVY